MTKQYENFADLITFTRASTGTYLDSDGLLKTATTNTPRIEFDINGNRKGILIEEARTNLVLSSSTPDIRFFAGGDITAVQTTILGVNAKSFTRTNDTFSDVFPTNNSQAVTAGLSYTFSFYALSPTGSTIKPAVRDLSNSIWIIGHTTSDTSTVLTDVPTRFSYTFTAPAGCSSVSVRFHYGVGQIAGETFVFAAPQLEEGSFPTSYIPTAGAAASRSADVASIPTSAFGYNADKGTVVVDFSRDHLSIAVTPTFKYAQIASLDDGTTANRVSLALSGTFRRYRADVADNSVLQFQNFNVGDGATSEMKVALTFAENNFAALLDGGTVATDTSGTVPPVNNFVIGGRGSDGLKINGYIKSIQYYPRRLTNSQLVKLTS